MKRVLASLATLPLAATLLSAGLLASSSTTAHADDRVCRGTIGKVTIDDNIVVPRGATCTLTRTRVEGNIEVKGDGYLIARGVRVDGNIQGNKARRVAVRAWQGQRSVVAGNIQLKRGTRGGKILDTVVDGDIQLTSNRGKRFVVKRNVVDGNLQCKSNKPAPRGGKNRVEGNKEGQCRRL
ncbi:hypothetical protein [Nocardioides gilvus]|uniref:hypothetical protein n=1 Tax=Nocardioides gilvus TaxID=1735589 RepID=UPI000D74BF53|nr:hypothetical protein [Nocardioides gilvus]